MINSSYDENCREVKRYILAHVKDMLKQPRSYIRYPFIDPGSVYNGNVWDWDTYWAAYGLFSLFPEMDRTLREQVLLHAEGNVRNFLDHQAPDGYIPMMIEVTKEPAPYLELRHAEGIRMNMHKPFLAQQIMLISGQKGNVLWAEEMVEPLERYFTYYRSYFNANCGLYVWHDDITIGVDNDPTTFGRPQNSTANIFLNSFMVCELNAMKELLTGLGMDERAETYALQRDLLIQAIQNECWDPRDGFFYSADADVYTRCFDWFHKGLGVFWKTIPLKIRVWSGFLPMHAGFATNNQAERLVSHMTDENTFANDWGICTLSKDEKMFNVEATNNPSNWLGPVWLVSNYLAFSGLMRYGYRTEAELLAQKTMSLLAQDLRENGCLHEYYDPFTGKPVMNGGFINWNVLALTMAEELKKQSTEVC